MKLFERNVEKTCQAKLDQYAKNCSGFVGAVATDLLVLVPGMSSLADDQVFFMRAIATPLFRQLGSGRTGELRAVASAAEGNFVICGITSTELQKSRSKPVSHGHVAVVANGWATSGWPLGYWGSLGGMPGRRESLGKSFRESDRPIISYFSYLIT